MKTSNKIITALVAVALITLLSCFSETLPLFVGINNSISEHPESIDEEYGFDRLDQDEDVYWSSEINDDLPENHTVQLFDTLSVTDWDKYANSIKLIQNPGGLWPLNPRQNIRLLRPGNTDLTPFLSFFSKELLFKEQLYVETNFKQKLNCAKGEEEVFVYVMNETTYNAMSFSGNILNKLYDLAIHHPVLMVYFGANYPEKLHNWPITLFHIPEQNTITQALAAQSLVSAKDVYTNNGTLFMAQRLGRSPVEYSGMDMEKLEEIDRWVEKSIRRKVMPGCQVLVAKSGRIIYNKAFGYHTYDKKRAVSTEDVYDIASITKAAGTTLGIMKLEEMGQLDLAGRLRDYMPDYKRTSLSYLRVRHLLSHHTGLQGNLPIARFLNRDDIFQNYASSAYNIAVDQDLYLKSGVKDELLAELKRVKAPRRNFFRYSDVNFIILQQLLEHQAGQSLDQYLSLSFYQPLGLQHLQYRPGLNLDKTQIIPTEQDKKWRKHLVHGEVHDESALLLGGIAGNAGLFSNAKDLAIIFQMLLNKGAYGGEHFFDPATVERFTSKNNYNYRALGFDRLAGHSKNLRRYGASLNTFGHTGFTGTCVWADPDNDLIFIFLSNRIYPSKRNNKLQKTGLRERLHKIVYQSLREGKKLAIRG